MTTDREAQKLTLALKRHEDAYELKAVGDLAGAEAACREALALFAEMDGEENADTADLLQTLGSILLVQCRYHESEECGRRAAGIMDRLGRRAKGPHAELILIQSLGVWGTALRQLGWYAEAEPILKRAIDLAEKNGDQEALGSALNNLGVLYKYSGNFEEAHRVYSRGLAIAVELYGEHSSMAAVLYHNLGGLAQARGRFEEGETPARRAWEIRRELMGEDHPETLADACAYCEVLDALERFAESRPIYQKALEVYERVFGPEHFEVAATLHNLAGAEAAVGEGTRAEQHYRRALAIKGKTLGEDHPDWALTANNLAGLVGDRTLMERASKVFEARLAEGHPLRELARANLTQM